MFWDPPKGLSKSCFEPSHVPLDYNSYKGISSSRLGWEKTLWVRPKRPKCLCVCAAGGSKGERTLLVFFSYSLWQARLKMIVLANKSSGALISILSDNCWRILWLVIIDSVMHMLPAIQNIMPKDTLVSSTCVTVMIRRNQTRVNAEPCHAEPAWL